MDHLIFGKRCEDEQQNPQDRYYSKADVMAALSKVEASTTGLGEEKDSEPFKCFNAGANAMAEALLDEADAETVREKKTQAIYEIVLDELFKMAKKGIEREMGI